MADPNAPKWLVVATGLIATAIPVTTCVRETAAKGRELAVSRSEQEFRVKSTYLDRAVDPARPPKLRQAVLRFLVQTSDDERMRQWAEDELKLVGAEVNDLQTQISALRTALEQKDQRIESVSTALDRERSARNHDAKALAAMQSEIAALNRSKTELEAKIDRTNQKLTGVGLSARIEGRTDATANLTGVAGSGGVGNVDTPRERNP